MPRMQILGTVERQEFETPPVFTILQRNRYFDFSAGVLALAKRLRGPTSKVLFLVSLGQFRATHKFYLPDQFHQQDIDFVARSLGLTESDVDCDRYDKQTRIRHRRLIRAYFGFKAFDTEAQTFTRNEIKSMARLQLQPRLILFRAIDLLRENRVEIPSYPKLSRLILAAINHRRNELSNIIKHALDTNARKQLELLIHPAEEDKANRYLLTQLKRLSQSTKPSKIKERIDLLHRMRSVYNTVQPALRATDLNHTGIGYFANTVIKSDVRDVTRRFDPDRYVHLIAFIAHQYYRLQDNLVDVLLSVLQSNINSARREHKERSYEAREAQAQSLRELIQELDEDLLGILQGIDRITNDTQLTDTEKVNKIKSLMRDCQTSRQQIETTIQPIRERLDEELHGHDYYSILEARSIRIQNRISPILRAITFSCSHRSLNAAIQHFQHLDGVIDHHAPRGFLKPAERLAVAPPDGNFRVSLYKVFLFLHVMNGIKSGTLNLKHSYKYRALDDYLIPKDRWQREREDLLRRANMQSFNAGKAELGRLEGVLSSQYRNTNRNLIDGENAYAKLTAAGQLRVTTPRQDSPDVEPLESFFPGRHYIALSEILATVNRHSQFLSEIRPWQQRYHRERPPDRNFVAGIVGLGCGIGVRKIARISRHINESQLENTVNWSFTPENLVAANDRILRTIDQLDLPNIYRRHPHQLHTSSDGQKFEVRAESLNANYSYKYFGKGQGVSVYSFIDERQLLFYSTVISAAERESAYVIDGLMHNDIVQSDIHSTDTHGYSELIFGVMHLLGFSYAPRIKNFKRQRLYGSREMRRDASSRDYHIKPRGYVNTHLILDHWEDILRFIASIKLKEVTASELFRRLNSYSKQHDLYRALKAFGQIIKSIFLLRYIDEVELRQAVTAQLNKIEHAQRFSRAISVGGPREFEQVEKQAQEIEEGCKRLIKNAITCWNYLYLSQRLIEMNDAQHRQSLANAVRHGSVISWQHINLLGEYDFSDERLQDSVGIRPLKWHAEQGVNVTSELFA